MAKNVIHSHHWIRKSCHKCPTQHTKKSHKSHGYGSFCKTHNGAKGGRGKNYCSLAGRKLRKAMKA